MMAELEGMFGEVRSSAVIASGGVRSTLAGRRAQIHDFIQTLPQQYDTRVGERGVRLSGGQRQRIGLARAFYKQATVLVLDEATSALDDQTEAEVMKTIEALGPEVTVLMIAHRLSTLKGCALIVHMQSGGQLKLVHSLDELNGAPEDDPLTVLSEGHFTL